MKFTAVLLSALFAVSAVHAADIDPNTVDPCIRDCTTGAAGEVGCSSPLDAGCVCGDKKGDFTSKALACLSSKCADKIGEASALQAKLCG